MGWAFRELNEADQKDRASNQLNDELFVSNDRLALVKRPFAHLLNLTVLRSRQ